MDFDHQDNHKTYTVEAKAGDFIIGEVCVKLFFCQTFVFVCVKLFFLFKLLAFDPILLL